MLTGSASQTMFALERQAAGLWCQINATRSERGLHSAEPTTAAEQVGTSFRQAMQIGTRTSFMLAGQVGTKTSFMLAGQIKTCSRQVVHDKTSFGQAGQTGTSSRQAVQVKTSFRQSTTRQQSTKVLVRKSVWITKFGRSKQGHLLLDRSALKECFRHSVHGRIPWPSAGKSALPSTHNLYSSGTGD